jgi:hypothetical protein
MNTWVPSGFVVGFGLLIPLVFCVVLCLSLSCVPNIPTVSGLSIFDCPFVFSNVHHSKLYCFIITSSLLSLVAFRSIISNDGLVSIEH